MDKKSSKEAVVDLACQLADLLDRDKPRRFQDFINGGSTTQATPAKPVHNHNKRHPGMDLMENLEKLGLEQKEGGRGV